MFHNELNLLAVLIADSMTPIADTVSAGEFISQANAIQRMVQVDVERIAGSYIMGDVDSSAEDFHRASHKCIEEDAMAASLEATLQQEIEEDGEPQSSQWMLYEIGGVRYIVTVDMQLYQKAAQEYNSKYTTMLDYPEDIWIVSILPELKRQQADRLNK